MKDHLETPEANPFYFSEYFIMTKPIGRMATNLRELLQAIREVGEGVIHYHLWQSRMTISHPTVEYPNDFAFWAATALQESRLAEKLSAIDPFGYENMEQIREALVDLIEEYLWDLPYTGWVRPGFEFHFSEAATVVLRSDVCARTLPEFCEVLEKVGLDSIFYHFVDARWRSQSTRMDDFSNWINTSFELPDLVSAIQGIDISFYSLDEVRRTIIDLCSRHIETQ